jgi:hypothetical protein
MFARRQNQNVKKKDLLAKYRQKRDFGLTPEPAPSVKSKILREAA